MAVVMFSLSN